MKVLIIQLARFGDIYSCWPALNAYKRLHPEDEVHLLVRDRFKSATMGLGAIDKVVVFNTASVLEEVLKDAEQTHSALEKMNSFASTLRAENYDKVYNISFSPFSSYLANTLRSEKTCVLGYSRHSDGFLNISDDWSAYFYAQVGIQRPNRVHLTEIFSQVLQSPISGQDWSVSVQEPVDIKIPGPYIVIHVGASQKSKAYLPSSWATVANSLLEQSNYQIVFIGSKEEESLIADHVDLSNVRFTNLFGQTKISDLFSILSGASLLIGADSAPIHVASLVNTVTLNLSCSAVNLWETGPLAMGSRILFSQELTSLSAENIVHEAVGILNNHMPKFATHYVAADRQILNLKSKNNDFEWKLINYIYFGENAPMSSNIDYASALVNLYDLNSLAIEQLYQLQQNPADRTAQAVLARTDEIMKSVAERSPEAAVLIRWFQTEKIRIPPGGFISVLEKTFICHKKLGQMITELQQNINLSSYSEVQSGNTNLER